MKHFALLFAVPLLAACTACPFSARGRIVSNSIIPPERITETLDQALMPLRFSREACRPIQGLPKLCDYVYVTPGLVNSSTRINFLADDLSIRLVDYGRSESKLDRRVETAIQDALRSNLGATFDFEKAKTSYSCVLGP